MHLTLSLTGHGCHPAAWRQSSGPALPGYRAPMQRAEAAGLDAVLLGPALGSPGLLLSGGADAVQLDPMPLLGSLVPHSRVIGLGASVFMSHTEPFHTARAFAVLDNLSAGRTAWCVDTQQLDYVAADFGHLPLSVAARYARAREYIEVVKQLWDSWQDDTIIADKPSGIFAHGTKVHRIDHAGDYFTVRGPLTAIRPRQGRPVIVQWDMSAEGLALAAATADVFLASCQTLAEAQAFSTSLRAATAAAGRDPAALRILLNITPILAASAAAAEARAATLDAAVPPALAGALIAEAGDTLLATRSGLRFIGTAASLAEQMCAWVAAGACDGWNLRPAVLPDDLDALLSEVAPLLRRAGQLRTAYAGATLREHLGLARPANPNAA